MSDQRGQRSSRVEEIESRVFTFVLLIAFFVSIAGSAWKFFDNQTWTFPLIFLALLIQLRWLDTIRQKVELITVSAPLRIYDSHAEFYADALRALVKSKKTVYAVFSHATAPHQHTKESRKYYAGTLKWARKSPGLRALHRVIRLPASSPDIQQWVDEQINTASQIENYRLRVLRYPPGMELEGENFAIMDSSIVFLGFDINERGEMKGFSIRDPRVARALEQYFQELWNIAGDNTNSSTT